MAEHLRDIDMVQTGIPMKFWMATALLTAALALGACDELTNDTSSLLRDGDPRICGQQEVQSTLTKLIVTKTDAMQTLGGEHVSSEEIQKIVNDVSLSYSLTTAEAADKSISKVTCSTNGTLVYPGGSTDLPLVYSVKPAIDGKENEFVVYVEDLTKARLAMLVIVADELRKIAEARAPQSEPLPPAQTENETQPNSQLSEPADNISTMTEETGAT